MKAIIAFKKMIASIALGNFLIIRFLTDAFAATDAAVKSLTKSLTDASSASDSETKAVGKGFSDGSSFSDSEIRATSKALSDNPSATDSQSFGYTKATADTSSTADAEIKDFHKFINENTGVTDDLDGEASTDDDQTMTFVKVRSELATMIDILTIVQGKLFSDASALTDSGSVRNQGYCDFSYFEADYVGDSRTF
jgi:hypothetical protein